MMGLGQVSVVYRHSFDKEKAKAVAEQWQLPYGGDLAALNKQPNVQFALVQEEHLLALHKLDEPKLGAVWVDFVGGAVGHRQKYGGGRGQEIAKAVGLKHGFNPTVLDGTAGLGRDAYVLASLGCKVQLFERNPVVAALLNDGIERASVDAEIGELVTNNMLFSSGSSFEQMTKVGNVDVVYLDPMYPHKGKSALVKKEMRVFQSLVGADDDADNLLSIARDIATYRVVVKRPNYAEPLAGVTPSTSVKMKKNRFDIYVNRAIPKN